MIKVFKWLRQSKGVTQKELAEKLKLGRTTIALWDTGKSTPNLATLKKVAEVLDCELMEVINCFI